MVVIEAVEVVRNADRVRRDRVRAAPLRRLRDDGGKLGEPLYEVALLGGELGAILDAVPELLGRSAVVTRALLPGPYTLVLPNPARRFRWLTGSRPDTIGIRVPDLPPETRAVLDQVGLVAATSANVHGGRDPRNVDEIPDEVRSRCAGVLDGGELPGIPSTVVDLTEREPQVLREGAVPAAEAVRRIADALG